MSTTPQWLQDRLPGIQVLADSNDRESWLKARESYLTASQAAAAVGKSHWDTREDVLLGKFGLGREFKPNPSAWWGLQAEESNLAGFARLMGVTAHHNTQFVAHERAPGMACTPDGFLTMPLLVPEGDPKWVQWGGGTLGDLQLAIMKQGLVPVDVKSVKAKNGYLWSPEPGRDLGPYCFDCGRSVRREIAEMGEPELLPEYYGQMQLDLAVLGLDVGLVVARVDSDKTYAWIVEADPVYRVELLEAAEWLRKSL